MRPRPEYIALRTIVLNGVRAYNPGDDVAAGAVDNLGLAVGVDVSPANPTVVPRPRVDAPRREWEAYAVGQGLTADEVADMTVTALRERFPEEERTDASPVPLPPARNASTEAWQEWVLAARPDVDADKVTAMGRDELVAAYAPKGV